MKPEEFYSSVVGMILLATVNEPNLVGMASVVDSQTTDALMETVLKVYTLQRLLYQLHR